MVFLTFKKVIDIEVFWT